MIEAREVCVAIGRRPIVIDAGFVAEPGQITAVVGPNGSGKTTLLRALSGDLAYGGQIAIDGRDLRKLTSVEAAAVRAVLPQSTSLSFPFTVREIVRLGVLGGVSGVAAADERFLPDLALERVDLSGFAGRLYQELSGGEQQRVQMARVLCQVWTPLLDGHPRWLLLDEPVSSLDIRHQLIIMDIAREFASQGGGVIAILHDLNLTAMYASTVLVMHQGRVFADGPPGEIMRDHLFDVVFGCRLRVGRVPPGGAPFVLPQSAAERAV